ncbi:MAG: hypothetical protein ACR2ND_10695 [Solirubrobacteraceae bacterium]
MRKLRRGDGRHRATDARAARCGSPAGRETTTYTSIIAATRM